MEYKLNYLIDKSNLKHNNLYDYSKCNQIEYKVFKNEIICPKHGSFYKSWEYHLNNPSGGCNFCIGKRPRRDRKQWLEYLNSIYANKYDYSKTDFTLGVMALNTVICPKHGEFRVTMDNHSTKKSGCPKCSGKKWDINDFITEAKLIHGELYDYSKTIFEIQSNKVIIICQKHGEFFQTPHHHIYQKQGCFKCGREVAAAKMVSSIEEILNQARQIHFDDYEYDFSGYNFHTFNKIKIICSKHGEFYQQVSNHLQGQGCPNCKRSIGELKVRKYLINRKINYIQQYKFEDCKNVRQLMFDFYLPDYNTCIEFDGEQHTHPTKIFGGQKGFERIQENDQIKNKYCFENNIKLIRISFKEVDIIDEILSSIK